MCSSSVRRRIWLGGPSIADEQGGRHHRGGGLRDHVGARGAWFRTIGLGSLAIVLPLVAALLPSSRLGVFRNDLSYGTYLWAFPIQQTLAFLGIAAIHWLFLGGSVVLTLVLAGLGWKLIEQPSLRLKKKRLRVGRPRTAPL